jgi:hypothetical protein
VASCGQRYPTFRLSRSARSSTMVCSSLNGGADPSSSPITARTPISTDCASAAPRMRSSERQRRSTSRERGDFSLQSRALATLGSGTHLALAR